MRSITLGLTALGLVGAMSLTGCGSGGGGSQDATGFDSQLPTRFSVIEDPATHQIIFRGTDNSVLTEQGVSQIIQADLVNLGGSNFTIFDPVAQELNPAFPSGTGRFAVTVRPGGTQSNPMVRFFTQDNLSPTTSFVPFDVTGTTAGTGLIDTANQFFLQNGFPTNVSLTGATAFSTVGNPTFVWISNNAGPGLKFH
jgi:hypothetical protein